jgi:hypothetical protein
MSWAIWKKARFDFGLGECLGMGWMQSAELRVSAAGQLGMLVMLGITCTRRYAGVTGLGNWESQMMR